MPFAQAVLQRFTDEWFDELNRAVFSGKLKEQGEFLRICNGGM